MKRQALSLLSLVGAVAAQSGPYGQCGGNNWSGPTTCVAGYTCVRQNEWYSQCIPGTATTSTTLTTTTTTTRTTTTTTSTRTTTTSVPTSTDFPSADGLNFTIDGVTDYFAGSNSYWISMLTNDADVDLVMGHIASSGHKILRVWGFSDINTLEWNEQVWFQRHDPPGVSTINTDGQYGLPRLDAVVAAAERHGIKLIIPLVNNWDDYGGMSAYLRAYGGTTKTDWYHNPDIQAAYRAYIAAVVDRYIGSSAVFAWELANEPRCNGCDTSILFDWISETSAYIKSLDPLHMVAIGDEGFGLDEGSDGSYPFSYAEGLDFAANLGIDTIDFGTIHLYPGSWGTSYDWGNLWVRAHGAACAAAGKPCLFEEYGAPSDHCGIEVPWQTTAVSSTGIAGDLFWQWGDNLSTGLTHDDGNTIYYGSADYQCLVVDHQDRIAAR
ncbi:putative mannan endo-1,4-beta-mannosidase F [Aspergillus karnatakaensis]|uniref:putative mannan endo-1,4-beta-mannosidase F n=1 Tax=Aspergillus karnatakaensis TaxID=1810916 RepID=UPI003CCD485F